MLTFNRTKKPQKLQLQGEDDRFSMGFLHEDAPGFGRLLIPLPLPGRDAWYAFLMAQNLKKAAHYAIHVPFGSGLFFSADANGSKNFGSKYKLYHDDWASGPCATLIVDLAYVLHKKQRNGSAMRMRALTHEISVFVSF